MRRRSARGAGRRTRPVTGQPRTQHFTNRNHTTGGPILVAGDTGKVPVKFPTRTSSRIPPCAMVEGVEPPGSAVVPGGNPERR